MFSSHEAEKMSSQKKEKLKMENILKFYTKQLIIQKYYEKFSAIELKWNKN